MDKLFNAYGLKARVFPAILCSLPIVVIKVVLVDKYIPGITEKVLTFAIAGVPIWLVLVYFLTQINRFISKTFFENKNDFPTLKMLMPSGKDMSQNMRAKITQRAKNDFEVLLPNLQEEQSDPTETRTRIKEIVGLIITKVGSGKLLLQHNIEYGFVRNLIGGSVLAAITCLANICIFRWVLPNHLSFIISVILLAFYLIPILFSKPIIKSYSQEYAEKLFREYVEMA